MKQLGEALERMWTRVPASAVAGLPERILGPSAIGSALREWPAGPGPVPDATCRLALEELKAWLADSSGGVFRSCPDPVFGRGDPNLDNVLWHEDGIHLVDFEDSGRSCRAYELAELVEHLGSRATSDPEWLEFAATHVDGCAETFLDTRRAFAGFWLLMLLPGGPAHARNPAGSDVRQAERLLSLFGG